VDERAWAIVIPDAITIAIEKKATNRFMSCSPIYALIVFARHAINQVEFDRCFLNDPIERQPSFGTRNQEPAHGTQTADSGYSPGSKGDA